MKKLLLTLICWGFVPLALAQELAPEQLVQKVTDEVLAAIKADKQLAAGDKQKAVKLAEEKVLPYIDFEEATRLAVGRAWAKATPEQKKRLVSEFRSMLVRTYSTCAPSTCARARRRCRSTSRCTRPATPGRSTTSRWRA
ncbi:MAG: hypothetical protein K0S03_1576 [Burkholderiales bacterium]|nr:hypothetical protein [Burkholderiales bacterium]